MIDIKGVEGKFKKWFIRFYGICEDYRIFILNDIIICKEKCKKGCFEFFNKFCFNCILFCYCDFGECLFLCNVDDDVDFNRKECYISINVNFNIGDDEDDDEDDFVGKKKNGGLGYILSFIFVLSLY